MGIKVNILLDLQGHEGIDIPWKEYQSVVRAKHLAAGELVGVSAAGKAKCLEYRERGVSGQHVKVHDARLLYHMVRIVGLIYGDGDPVRGVGDLRNRVDDESIVLLAVVGGHDIEAVTDIEQCGEIVLIRSLAVLRNVIGAKLVRKRLELVLALITQCRKQGHGRLAEGQLLAVCQHVLYGLCGKGRPGAVLDDADGAVLIAALCKMNNEISHKREDIRIVGGCRKHELSIAECGGNGLRLIAACKVENLNVRTALVAELVGEQLHRLAGVAIDGGVGDHYALGLDVIARPDVIKVEIIAEILLEHRTVERTDDGDIERRCLLEKVLHLNAVLADDADEIASCLIDPGFVNVQRTEFSESVGGEQHLVAGIIGHYDLGPVNHRRRDEGEGVLAERKGIALRNHYAPFLIIASEVVLHHDECLLRGNYHGVLINLHEVGDISCVIGLHVLNDQVIGLPSSESGLDIVQPFMGEMRIHSIHDRGLFINDGI